MTKTLKNRLLGVLLALLIVTTGLFGVSFLFNGKTASASVDSVTYLDEDGNTQTVTMVNEVNSGNGATWGGSSSDWFVVQGDVTMTSNITVQGKIKLIICDGATLDFKQILLQANASITIYSQSYGSNRGKMVSSGVDDSYCGVIGTARHVSTGDIGIYGVEIDVCTEGRMGGAVIGSAWSSDGSKTSCGDITVKNASINIERVNGADTTNLNWGSLIGAGYSSNCGDILIENSTIVAGNCACKGAMIGSGMAFNSYSECGDVTIKNSNLTLANNNADEASECVGACIGAANDFKSNNQTSCRNITIENSELNLTNTNAVCIGGGTGECNYGDINISGSTLNLNRADHSVDVAYIGGSDQINANSNVTIDNCKVNFDDASSVTNVIAGGENSTVTTDNYGIYKLQNERNVLGSATFNYTGCYYNENGFCVADHESVGTDCTNPYEECEVNEDGVYEIKNGGNLFWFAKKVNAGEYSINAKIVVDKIDLESREYTSVGSGNGAYTGTFEGNGATISNLYIKVASDNQGLFGYLSGGVVNNFVLEGKIEVTAKANNVGAVVGNVNNRGTVKNVTSNVTIKDIRTGIDATNLNNRITSLGGIVGYMDNGVIENCDYNGDIDIQVGSSVSGIVGMATTSNGSSTSSVSDCNNYAVVSVLGSGSAHIGGVAGDAQLGTKIIKCINYGDVASGGADCIGGVVAYANQNVRIENCANIGDVACTLTGGERFIAGILGYINNASFGGIYNCFNYGSIVTDDNNKGLDGAIVGYNKKSGNMYSNNYYLNTSCTSAYGVGGVAITATSVTLSQFKNGEVAWRLNGGKEDGSQVWYQVVNSDDYPNFGDAIVYRNITGGCEENSYTYEYSNSDGDVTSHCVNGLKYAVNDNFSNTIDVYCADCNITVGQYTLNIEDKLVYTGQAFTYTIDGNEIVDGCLPSNPSVSTLIEYRAKDSQTYQVVSEIKEAGFYRISLTIGTQTAMLSLENADTYATIQKEIEVVRNIVKVDFVEFDGSAIESLQIDDSNKDELNVPQWDIPNNYYYTYNFKYWNCKETGKNYTSDDLPSYEELWNNGYTEVTFKAVYNVTYNKSFHLKGTIDEKTGLSTSGIYGTDKNVKIVSANESVDIYTNYAIMVNDGIASLLLIPEYNSKIFTIKAVSVNGQLVLGDGAESTALLKGWDVTVTKGTTEPFKILLEQLPNSDDTGEAFIQIIYNASKAVNGEYSFGFKTAYKTDTYDNATDNDVLSHNDRSEAYGVLSSNDNASLCELKITVDNANVVLIARQKAEVTIINGSVVYDTEEVDVEEDCSDLSASLTNIIKYHYNAYDITLADGVSSYEWTKFVTLTWYDANGNKLNGAPKDVGNYKLGVYIQENDYFEEFAEKQFDVSVTPYTIDLSAEHLNDKTYNGTEQSWTEGDFTVTDLISALNGEKGYDLEIVDATYKNAGTYTVKLKFTATSNYTFTQSGQVLNAGDTKEFDIEVAMNRFSFTVVAVNKTSEYSDELKNLEWKYYLQDFENTYTFVADDIASNNLVFTLTTTASNRADKGTYEIEISYSDVYENYKIELIHNKDENYAEEDNGTYTITPKVVEIPVIGNLTYNGEGQFPTVPSEATINGLDAYRFEGDHQTNADTYTLKAILESDNYAWSGESDPTVTTKQIEWKIVPVEITVTIGTDWTSEYGETLQVVKGEITSGKLFGTDTLDNIGLSYNILGTYDEYGYLPVGTYDIEGVNNGSNYSVNFIDGRYEVTIKVLDGDDWNIIFESIIGSVKNYTGSELDWDISDFTIDGSINGVNYSNIVYISKVAKIEGTDYLNANGKLENNTFEYWKPKKQIFYTVSVNVDEDFQNSYAFAKNGEDAVYTKDGVQVEVFIAQATNDWETTPFVNADNIDDFGMEANALFKADDEVAIVIKENGKEVTEAELVVGKTYVAIFTVSETNNYTGLSKEVEFELGYAYVYVPTVRLDGESGEVCDANASVSIVYDGKTHQFVVVQKQEDKDKYTIEVNTGDNYSSWKNANGEYFITISLNTNYSWSGEQNRDSKVYTLVINKKSLKITANSFSLEFGKSVDEYQTTADEFVEGESYDTYGEIDVNSLLECSYRAGDQEYGKVGPYDITFKSETQNILDALLINYEVTLENGVLTVTAMNLNLDFENLLGKLDDGEWKSWASLVVDGYSVEYNGSEHIFYLDENSYPSQLVATIKYNGSKVYPVNGGTYSISVSFNVKDGLVESNYSWQDTADSVTLIITKVGVKVTANSQEVIYTGNNVILNTTDSSQATLSLDDERDITDSQFDFIRNTDTGIIIEQVRLVKDYKDVGDHENAITTSLTYNADNYEITFVNGTLTIKKGELGWTIELITQSRVYNGATLEEGLSQESQTIAEDYYAILGDGADRQYLTYKFFTMAGGVYTEIASAPSVVGTYYVKAFYDDFIAQGIEADYKEIVISKASITIDGVNSIVKGYLQDYNGDESNFQAVKPTLKQEDGYIPGVDIKYYKDGTVLSGKPIDAGEYTIKVSVNNLTENYTADELTVSLVINKAKLDVADIKYNLDTATWFEITQDYDDALPINKYYLPTLKYTIVDENGDEVKSIVKTFGDNEVDLSFTAEKSGKYKLIVTVTDSDNFIESQTEMNDVFSVSFLDKEESHSKTKVVYEFKDTEAKTQYRFSGQTATQPPCCNDDAETITIDGYTFAKSWTKDGKAFSFASTITSNVILYAEWDIDTYTVIWQDGETVLDTEIYEYLDTPIYKKGEPTRSATAEYYFTFAGWSLSEDGEVITISPITTGTTYFATYTKDGVTYEISFMLSIDGKDYTEYKMNVEAKFGEKLADICPLDTVAWFRYDMWYGDALRTEKIETVPVNNITVYGAYIFDIGNGDVNADGVVSTNDITIYREWIVGGYEMTVVAKGSEWEFVHGDDFGTSTTTRYFLIRVADVNADTSDDIRDVTTIRMSIVDGYGYEIAKGLKKAKVTGEAVTVISPEIRQPNYEFGTGSIYKYAEMNGNQIKVDPTNLGAFPSGNILTDNWFTLATDDTDGVENETPYITYKITKKNQSSFVETNDSESKIFSVAVESFRGKIYVGVKEARSTASFTVGDIYTLSFSIKCGGVIYEERKFDIEIIDYALEYTVYSNTHKVTEGENNYIDVDCTLRIGVESTSEIVTIKIDNVPPLQRNAEFFMVNYEVNEGDTLIAKDDRTPEESDKFIVTVNKDNLSNGYFEITLVINENYDYGSTVGDLQMAINNKDYTLSFTVAYGNEYISNQLCEKEYTIHVHEYLERES